MPTSENPSSERGELKAILAPIEKDLLAVEAVIDEVIRAPSKKVRPMLERIRGFRGKMLRPAFVVLAGRCFGEVGNVHHHLGAVVELIHTATLVHDDVLDAADIRRRIETVNKGWGNTSAVLLGDYLFATAFALSAGLDNPLASRYLSWVSGVVCQGEILQIVETGNLDLDEETYFEVIEKKTAFLFAGAARVGAEYSGASEAATDALTAYGMKLGTAFQIIDDCLDLDGVEERVGKTLGTDARQGKATLPVIHYLQTAAPEKVAKMREILGGGEGDLWRDDIRVALEEHGSLQYARDRAGLFAKEAVKGLAVVPESPARETLERLARYTLSRRR